MHSPWSRTVIFIRKFRVCWSWVLHTTVKQHSQCSDQLICILGRITSKLHSHIYNMRLYQVHLAKCAVLVELITLVVIAYVGTYHRIAAMTTPFIDNTLYDRCYGHLFLHRNSIVVPRGVYYIELARFGYPLVYFFRRPLYYLAFQYFECDRTWWRLFQKRDVDTKLDIYVFITMISIISY
jgi:hypothetical protein